MTEKQEFQSDEKGLAGNEQISPTGTWKRVKARIRNTEAYQIFVERPRQKRSSRVVYSLFIIFSFLGHTSLTWILTPPLKFDELNVVHGYFEGYTRGSRSTDWIKIRYENGTKESFRVKLDYQELQKLNRIKGEPITVYYVINIHPLLYKVKYTYAIKYNNNFIVEYTQIQYERGLMLYKVNKIIALVGAAGALISLFCIYLMNRKHKII